MNSSGDITRCVVPSLHCVFSFNSTSPAALHCTRSSAGAGRAMKRQSCFGAWRSSASQRTGVCRRLHAAAKSTQSAGTAWHLRGQNHFPSGSCHRGPRVPTLASRLTRLAPIGKRLSHAERAQPKPLAQARRMNVDGQRPGTQVRRRIIESLHRPGPASIPGSRGRSPSPSSC